MWEEMLNMAISNGIWAVLFVFLLAYLLKDSALREKKYQETIESLSHHLDVVNDINENVKSVKKRVEKCGENKGEIKNVKNIKAINKII